MDGKLILDKLKGRDNPSDLIELLSWRAEDYHDQNVYNFIHSANEDIDSLSYQALFQKASALAASLQAMNAQGERVIILCNPSLQYMISFWGCLLAGAIAVPAFPPVASRLNKTLPRIEAIMTDCHPSIALATTDLIASADEIAKNSELFRNVRWVDVDQLDLLQSDDWFRPTVTRDDIAFLQYTSGSTSTPKGVMVSHGNLVHNSRAIVRTIEGANHFVSWLPPYHDMGLIGNIIQVVYGAGKGEFLSPRTFLRYPALWLQTLSRTKASISVAPNFGYEHSINKITDKQLEELDLSHWKYALSGAEPVRSATLNAFASRFSACGFKAKSFHPCYGLAEATLLVTGGQPRDGIRVVNINQNDLESRKISFSDVANEKTVESVACGHPAADTDVAIVDPDTLVRCGKQSLGEIWVHSPSVAKGYWDRPDTTQKTFRATIDGEEEKHYLRTGDLGFIDQQGELHISGRCKDLIVLRGRNLYPSDIEAIAQNAYEGNREKVVAFSIDVNGREELVVVMGGARGNQEKAVQLIARARKLLADAPLELTPYAILVVRSGEISQTSSGKVQRHAARNSFSSLSLTPIYASVTPEEDVVPLGVFHKFDVKESVYRWLEKQSSLGEIDGKTSITDLGIDYSALASYLQTLRAQYGIKVSLGQILIDPSVNKLVSVIEEQVEIHTHEPNDVVVNFKEIAPIRKTKIEASTLKNWLINKLASQLDLPREMIDLQQPFVNMGLDSKGSVELSQSLTEYLNIKVPETLVWDAPNLQAAIDYLINLQNSQASHSSDKSVKQDDYAKADEPIAIIGIGCRLPGADSAESFWKLLYDGRDAVSLAPSDRWDTSVPKTTKSGRSVSEWGGFLDQVDGFEPQIFEISNREAERMDPQQRLLLEAAWQALEHAGINPRSLAGSEAGVFVGIGSQEYWGLQTGDSKDLDIHSCTGNSQSVTANRISYSLDLRGPSMAIDTACSGSLVSVHLACESIKRGESNIALAGGVNLMLNPDLTVAFSEANMLSPSGRCSTFDESADGYVRGEGCGMVVLQRLSDAVRDRAPIIGVIEGSAVLHDGRSNGITAPNPQAQQAVIEKALAMSDRSASDIGYVEAHGTGTPLGDPIEAGVLARVYGKNRNSESPCLIGSVKTNIGHLESAAGIAGLIKAALTVERGYVPAHLHFKNANRKMDWKNSGLKVVEKGHDWLPSNDADRCAAVSSFGFGGTVAHLIVSSFSGHRQERHSDSENHQWHLLPLSARVSESIQQQISNVQQHLSGHHEQTLADICYTASLGRAAMERRMAVIGKSHEELNNELDKKLNEISEVKITENSPTIEKLSFCFTGQGSQFVDMAGGLIENEPKFAEVIERCDAIISSSLGYSLFDLLGKKANPKVLQDTRVLQPALYSLQCALAQLWKSWGVTPQLVLGHSIGDYAAMHVAGMFDLEDGLRLIDARAQAMAQQPKLGSMVACVGDLSDLNEILKEYAGQLWVAAYNSTNNWVVSGKQQVVDKFCKRSFSQFLVKKLNVSNAFHSPLMNGAVSELYKCAEKISIHSPKIPFISSLNGRLIEDSPTPDYFCQHLTRPVDFLSSINTAFDMGANAFVEIGPGRTLLNFINSEARSAQRTTVSFPSLLNMQENSKVVIRSLAEYWAHGGDVDWHKYYLRKKVRRVHIPTYQFSRKKYWHESQPNRNGGPMDKLQDSQIIESVNETQNVVQATLDLFRSQATVLEGLLKSNQDNSELKMRPNKVVNSIPEPTHAVSNIDDLQDNYSSISRKVKQYVAKIAGCASTDVEMNAQLNANLGLDSLMRSELDKLVLLAWPQLSQSDRAGLGEDPSVEELVNFISGSLGVVSNTMPVVAQVTDVSRNSEELTEVVPETDFEQSEAYCNHISRLNFIKAMGDNPYGRVHQGFNAAHSNLDGRKVINFASFNYTSLSNHPEVRAAAKDAIDTYGTSPSATPLLFGETALHHELESEIADYLGTEASVVFASGHSTSVAVIGHVMDKEDLIIHDQYIHDCAIRGAILSGAKRRSFSHDDWEELDRVLSQIRKYYRRVLIIIEGIYSQDGDIGNLPEFIKIKKKHQCMLMIDEAHSIGVLGKTGAGAGEYFGVDRKDVDIWMGTLSKGLGSCGGYIASTKNFVQFLKYTTPLLIFSTGITPANAAAALQSIRVLRKDPQRVHSLLEKSKWFLFRAKELGFDTGPSFDSPVIPIIVGSWEKAIALSSLLKKDDINVMPIGYPAVEKDKCRLRFFINVDHTLEELEFALQTLKQAIYTLDNEQNVSEEEVILERSAL